MAPADGSGFGAEVSLGAVTAKRKRSGLLSLGGEKRPKRTQEEKDLLESFKFALQAGIRSQLEQAGADASDSKVEALAAQIAKSIPVDGQIRLQRAFQGQGREQQDAYLQIRGHIEQHLEPKKPRTRERKTEFEVEDVKSAFEIVRGDMHDKGARVAKLEREIKEKLAELESLRRKGAASSGHLREGERLYEQLEEIGGFQEYLREVEQTAADKLTPEEHLAFAHVFIETLAAGKREKVQKRSGKYKIFIEAVRVARKRVRDGSVDIPAIVSTMEKDNFGTGFKNKLSGLLGIGSGVLDAGTVSSLVMYGLMSTYGAAAATLFKFGSAAHLGLFGVCILAFAPTLEHIEQEAWIKPQLQDAAFLNDRSKRTQKRGKIKRAIKRTAAQIASLLVTGVQIHSVLWTVAATNQGSDTSENIQEGINDQRRQISALDVAGFDEEVQSSFDSVLLDELDENPEFQALSRVEQEVVRLRLTRITSVRAEASGRFVEGAGGGTREGYGSRSAAKDVFGSGTTELAPEGPLSASAERGRQEGLAARARVIERFHERFPDHPGVFISENGEPVSIEEQILIFHNDYKEAMAPHLEALEGRFSNITELGNEIRRWTGAEVVEEGQEERAEEERSPLEDALGRIFGSWTVKGAFSIGKKAPSESTIAPEFEALAAPESPIFAIQNAFNDKFSEPATYFLQLVAQEINAMDATGSRAGAIRINVPEAELDPTSLTGVPLHGEPNFFSADFYEEAFSDPLRTTGAGLLIMLILLLRYGKTGAQTLTFRKNKEQIVNAFKERRTSFEGDGNTREGSEYRFAEHMAKIMNLIVSHKYMQGAFEGIRFNPEVVLSAMREAAAKERLSPTHESPLKTHEGLLGAIAKITEEYGEALVEIPKGSLPLPPAVEAFNQLVKLYRNPSRIAVRLLDELMPGFDELLVTSLSRRDREALRSLPVNRGLPEHIAEKYARIQAALNTVKVGHLKFRIRHERSRVAFMRGEAFNEIYHRVTGDEIKDLKFFNEKIDLRHADFDALRAQYGKGMDTLRHSAISRIITSEMQSAFDAANRTIEKAEEELQAIQRNEALTSSNYGGAVAKIMADARQERLKRFSDEAFASPTDPHVAQFSSVEALERQYIESITRRFEKLWGGEFEKNEEGTDLVDQLKNGMQKAVNSTSFFGTHAVPAGYGEPSVIIDPRVRAKTKGAEASSVSDQETEQFTDYHVVKFDFYDDEQKLVFSQEAEVRGLLSDQNTTEFVEKQIKAWIVNRQAYFSLRMNQWDLQKRLEAASKETERAIRSYAGGERLPFLRKREEASDTDYRPVDLFSKKAEGTIESLLKGLKPYLMRRDRLTQLERANEQARKGVEEKLRPAYSKALKRKGKGGETPEQLERSAEARHKSTRQRLKELENELKQTVIEERFDSKEFDRVKSLLKIVDANRSALRRGGIKLSYNLRSNSVSIRHKGLVGPANVQTLSTGQLLEQLAGKRDIAGTMKAIALRQEGQKGKRR